MQKASQNQQIKNWTIGSDFELFLFDKNINRVVNAKNYVKGSKKKPYNFDNSDKFWCTSLDNISFEGNIPPCTSGEIFDRSIKKVIDYMSSGLPKHLELVHDSAVYVNNDEFWSPESIEFGCESTLNAYNLSENERPESSTNLRTCCTHVHIKYDDMNLKLSAELVKAMDLFLGLPSLILEPTNDRRLLYGKFGEMRFGKNKTTEYRVLSSFFSKTPELRKWVFSNTEKAINWVNAGNRVSGELLSELEVAVATSDKSYINSLLQKYKIELPI